VKLDESNVPTEGRYCAIPPWAHGRLLIDGRFIKANEAATDQGQRNGQVGRAAGFDILVSNNIQTNAAPGGATNTNTRYRVIAGHSIATTFADQVSKVEAYRPEDSFADAVKGLHLYGAKVFRPEALVVCDVDVTVV
jgi:hypothetical protein